MSVKVDVITELNLFITQVAGSISDQDLVRYQELIQNTPGYQPTLNTLFDARTVAENLVTPENLIRISSSTPFDASVKRAYVVNDEKASMLATVFGTTSSINDKFFVTYKLDDACEWLGISPDDLNKSSIFKVNQ